MVRPSGISLKKAMPAETTGFSGSTMRRAMVLAWSSLA